MEGGLFLSQRKICSNIIGVFLMEDAKSKGTPMEPHIKLKKDEGKPTMDLCKFRQLVGSLIYLTITRPDLFFSVSVASQFMECP